MKILFSVFLLSCLMFSNLFAADFTVNGTLYNGQKFKVYPNSESTFKVKFTEGTVGSAESSSQSFVVRYETDMTRAQGNSSVNITSNMKNIDVFVKPNSGTRLNSTSKIILKPMLTSSNQTDFPYFEVVLSATPSISQIELMNSDIKNLQKGLPFRIIVKGSGLDDVMINLPKNLKSKIVKSSDKEMTLELSSTSKSYKGIVIDQSNFAVKSAKVNLKFDAKKLDLNNIK